MRVAFSGPSGSGKTTAAEYLVEQVGGVKVSFATSLKDAARMLGWDGMKDQRGRKYLQLLGQTVRSYDPLFWVKAALEEVSMIEDQFPSGDVGIFIDDMRFPNEADKLREVGFALVRLLPAGLDQSEGWRKDPSEVALDGYDFEYYLGSTMGDLPSLYGGLDDLVEKIDANTPRR